MANAKVCRLRRVFPANHGSASWHVSFENSALVDLECCRRRVSASLCPFSGDAPASGGEDVEHDTRHNRSARCQRIPMALTWSPYAPLSAEAWPGQWKREATDIQYSRGFARDPTCGVIAKNVVWKVICTTRLSTDTRDRMAFAWEAWYNLVS